MLSCRGKKYPDRKKNRQGHEHRQIYRNEKLSFNHLTFSRNLYQKKPLARSYLPAQERNFCDKQGEALSF